ncbi:hypothetical protein ACSSS7_002651 [Eimeria intestinalis]
MRLRLIKRACCVLVGLRMRLPHWTLLCLLVDSAVTASLNESSGRWDSQAEVMSADVDASTVTAGQTSRVLRNTELNGLSSITDTSDGVGLQLEDIPKQHSIENAKNYLKTLATAQKPSHRSRFIIGLCVSMVLFMCLGSLALRWKGPSSLQAVEESRIQQTGGIGEDLSKRLKALRALVSVAEELGKAVHTAEARELLEAIHTNVPKEGEEEDSTKLEMSIENALGALRGLQQAALKEAGCLLQTDFDNLSSVTLFLQEWEKAYLSDKESKELSPFIAALTSSQNHFLQVSQQMHEVYAGLEQAPPIRDEHDVTSLRYTADGLNFVVRLQQDRGNVAMLATEQRIVAEAAVRMTLSRGTTQGFRQRWGEFQIAQAYLKIAREGRGAAGAEGQIAAEVQGHLDEADLRLAQYEAELKQLIKYSRSKARDSISGALARTITLEQEQESLRASLARHWDLFNERVKMPEKLEESGRENVKMVLRQALQRISQDRDTMDAAITSTLSRMARVFDDLELNDQMALSKSSMHGSLQRRMAAEVLNLSGKGERRFVRVQSELQSVVQEEGTRAAAKMMKHAVASAVQSFDDLTAARLSLLRINLLISVDNTAKHTMEEAAKICAEVKSLLSNNFVEATKLAILVDSESELEDLLAQACWAARNAVALEDRVKAAGRMQELTLSLRHLSYTLKDSSFTR